MITKTLEIRDRATFIPVLAVKMEPGSEADRYLFGRAGFGVTAENQAQYIQVCRIDGGSGSSHCDPWRWEGGARTMRVAHLYINEHFDEMSSGEVVDVQHILKETKKKKVPERTMPMAEIETML